MITKAIVEEIISPYQVKVRIPILDRSSRSSLVTKSEDLNVATICTLPNCYMNMQVGDVVFVGFEDNTYYKAVVLGHLCREASGSTYSDLFIRSLNVTGSTELSSETSIGNITPTEIYALKGVKDNLQKQIDLLEQRLAILENEEVN